MNGTVDVSDVFALRLPDGTLHIKIRVRRTSSDDVVLATADVLDRLHGALKALCRDAELLGIVGYGDQVSLVRFVETVTVEHTECQTLRL